MAKLFCADNLKIYFAYIEHTHFHYVLQGTILQRDSSIRDLGAIFDTSLSFSQHINIKISEVHKVFGFLVRNCCGINNIVALKS